MRGPGQVLVAVFHHHHGAVDHRADGNGDPPQRHDIGVEPLQAHDDKGHENPQRQDDNRHQRAAHMQQEQHHHDAHDQQFLGQGGIEVGYRPLDEIAAVIDGYDLHPLGQAALQLGEFVFNAADGGQGVLAETHDDDAAGHLPLTVEFHHTAAQLRPQLHIGHIADAHRHAVGGHRQGNIVDILKTADIAAAAHHVLGFRHLHHASADIVVGLPDGFLHLAQGNVVAQQCIGVDFYLVLLDEATHRGHFRHTRHGLQGVAQVPVLDGAQVGEVVVATAVDQGVFKHPADAGGIGAQGRCDPVGQAARHVVQRLQYPRAGPVHIHVVFEDDVNEADPEEGIAPHHLGVGYRQHRRG